MKYKIGILILLFWTTLQGKTEPVKNISPSPILAICSYNPGANYFDDNIINFEREYEALNINAPLLIENMNCFSFSDTKKWKKNLTDILRRHPHPQAIILFGQEAWITYLTLKKEEKCEIPIFPGIATRHIVYLPEDTVSMEYWYPECQDALTNNHFTIKGGFLNAYDLPANIQLILDFYPDTRHIAFLSDNTYGGVVMQSLIKQEIKKFPHLELILLDGRIHTIGELVHQFSNLPEHTVALLGTWRTDRTGAYFVPRSLSAFTKANPHIPAFSVSSTGMGLWPLGGYMPSYPEFGSLLARELHQYLCLGKKNSEVHILPNHYNFDFKQLQKAGFTQKELPKGAQLINRDISFYEQYRPYILLTVVLLIILTAGLTVSLVFYIRARHLNSSLELSEKRLKKEKECLERSEKELRLAKEKAEEVGKELLIAKEKAEESDRMKTSFIHNMSHEIRTPLNAIIGFGEILSMEGNRPEETQEYVKIIQKNSDLLWKLVSDVLDISELESGSFQADFIPCDVVPFSRKILEAEAEKKSTKARFIFDSSVDTYWLETDIKLLKKLLNILLINAAKFTAAGEIILKLQPTAEEFIFSVTDSGSGIPLNKHDIIFERFEKLDPFTQGTGLGLPLCKLIAQTLGGRIYLDPGYRKGARFFFHHPLADPKQKKNEAVTLYFGLQEK